MERCIIYSEAIWVDKSLVNIGERGGAGWYMLRVLNRFE